MEPQTAEDYYNLAHKLRDSNFTKHYRANRDKAIQYIDQAIQLDPENIKYYLERAAITDADDEYDYGNDDWTKVIEISQDIEVLKRAHRSRSTSYTYARAEQHMAADLTWLIDRNFADDSIYVLRGNYWYRAEQFERALEDYTKSQELRYTDPVQLLRGQALYKLGRYSEALEAMIPLEFHDNWAEFGVPQRLHRWRGSAYCKVGNFQQALTDFNEALRLTGEAAVEDVAAYIEAHGLA